jgi:hypothetical protein
MHGGIEFELIVAASGGVVLVQGTVTTEKSDMFPGLKIHHANQIPGNIRSNAKAADIASQIGPPLLSKLPLPSQAEVRINPILALVDTG